MKGDLIHTPQDSDPSKGQTCPFKKSDSDTSKEKHFGCEREREEEHTPPDPQTPMASLELPILI